MPKPKGIATKWKSLGFIPEGWDESRMIKWRDKGFLYLAVQLRNGEFPSRQFTIRDRKWRPGRKGVNGGIDWTGLWETVREAGELQSPEVTVPIIYHTLTGAEREAAGTKAHQSWRAVRAEQKRSGYAVDNADLRGWDGLSDAEQEVFRRSGDTIAIPEKAMWDAISRQRKLIGERAFRRKMFELTVSITIENLSKTNHAQMTAAEIYQVTDIIVKLSDMLHVPEDDPSPGMT